MLAHVVSTSQAPLREPCENPKRDLLTWLRQDLLYIGRKLQAWSAEFDQVPPFYLNASNARRTQLINFQARGALGIGRWSADILENVIAYVGSELRVKAWSERAQRLIEVLPSPEAARSFIAGSESNEGDDPAATAETEPPPDDAPTKDKRKRPTPVHPAAIAWTGLVMEHLRQLIASVPDEGAPEDLRADGAAGTSAICESS